MQDSYWIALLGIIMFSLKTNSPNPEPIKTSDPGIPVSKKRLSSFQYSIVFPMKSFFKRNKNEAKKFI